MDKYLIRTQRDAPTPPQPKPSPKRLKQASIESLKGVVVVEDILRFKNLLKIPDQTSRVLVDTLEKLSQKVPSRDVLKSTKIGHTVNRLTKHRDEVVVRRAARLVKCWKKHFEEKLDRPMIEVKADRPTEKVRTAGRKYLTRALKSPEYHAIGESLEREVFHQHQRLINKAYRDAIFRLIRALKRDENLRSQLCDHTLTVSEFVARHKQAGQ